PGRADPRQASKPMLEEDTMRASLGFTVLVLAATAITVSVGRTPASASAGPYKPHIDPAEFQATIDNPYFPLVPGSTHKMIEKSKEGEKENEITVTRDTKVIMGVTCVVVHDVVRHKGQVEEDTYEWFAQDKHGTVWYFGEDTKEFHPGGVSNEGSWEA